MPKHAALQSGRWRCHKGQRYITLIRDVTAGQVFAHRFDTALFLSPRTHLENATKRSS